MIKVSMIDTTNVTPAQIGACHKVLATSGNFYLVESSKGEIDPATGYIKEYKVTYCKARGFQCQCKAAEYGNLCWHIRASVAAAREEKEAVNELHRLIAEQSAPVLVIDGKQADAATLERVMSAPVKPASKRAKAPESKAFSLLR